jgi:hypothetical protein
MKNLTLILGFIFSLQSFATDTRIICNDQNSHAVYRLELSSDHTRTKLVTLVGDSSVLSAGAENLKIQKSESSSEMSTYAGRSTSSLHMALLYNSQKAADLSSFEILEVTAYYQQYKGDILSGKTTLLCSEN